MELAKQIEGPGVLDEKKLNQNNRNYLEGKGLKLNKGCTKKNIYEFLISVINCFNFLAHESI